VSALDSAGDLLADLYTFLAERRGGELDGGADDEGGLWLACECGAPIRRTREPANNGA